MNQNKKKKSKFKNPSFQRIWSQLLKKSLTKNIFWCSINSDKRDNKTSVILRETVDY